MDLVREILRTALFLYFLLLIGRLIFEWVQVFAREWRPRGPVLVVAEGIENERQLQRLSELGVASWQGFLKSGPVPGEQLLGLMA